MPVGRMPRHQIKKDPDAHRMCLFKQFFQIIVCPIARGNFFIVTDIIAAVKKRRIKTGIDPQGIASKFPDLIQF